MIDDYLNTKTDETNLIDMSDREKHIVFKQDEININLLLI
jgi:hypothetical protein